MVRALDAGFAAMGSAVAAVVQIKYLDQLSYSGTTASAEVPKPHSAVQVVLPLAAVAVVALFAGVALVFRHLRHAAAGGNRRLSELVTFMLCASVGTLEYVFFVQPADVVISVGAAQVRALGLAAATVTFFLGMALVLVHVRAGGGGGRGDAVVRILSKMALGAAAALVGLMAMAHIKSKLLEQVLSGYNQGLSWGYPEAAIN